MENSNVQVIVDEEELDDVTLDELLEGLKHDDEEELQEGNKPCRKFWKNLGRSWNRPKGGRNMVVRFQRLAGIINNKIVAAVILPDGRRIEFKELPRWTDVIRFKVAGLTYETYV